MAQCFEPKDNIDYSPLRDVIPGNTTTVKGDPVLRNNCFGFYYKDSESTTEEVTVVFKMRQVLANKATGTGEAINSGDRLFYIVANNNVSPTPVGTPGTNSYFCGWALESVSASATTVLMEFDGTRYDETLSA